MSLLDGIPDLLSSDANFAYFCKFDRHSATSGKERIYIGNSVFSCKDDIDEETSDLLKSSYTSGPDIPVIFPYDFVTQVFPDSGIRRSEWPLLLGFIPDTTMESGYSRDENLEESFKLQGEVDTDYSAIVDSLRKRIISGEILQGVLSKRFDLPSVDPFERLLRFARTDHSLYVFLYRIGNFTVLGSSPENLITVSGGTAEIYPIAGTVPRGENAAEDKRLGDMLQNSNKDKLEHRMLVDLARNDLGKFSEDGSVTVSESMTLRKYASVQHLVSRVTSRVSENVSPLSILKAVFPAGTVSGAPKRRATELIDRLEPYPRGGYAGAAGIIGNQTIDLALLIRSLFSSGKSFYAQAGAGIVKDSVPENESMEVTSKVLTAIGGMRDECVDC